MLSILIPTYNYDVTALVAELRNQCGEIGIAYEILVFDDASMHFQKENQPINNLTDCEYRILPKNIGRSAIRNLLAKHAKYDQLLFLDADVMPCDSDFISRYFIVGNENKIVSGGLRYVDAKPPKALMLRWKYGRSRESKSALSRKEMPYQSLLASNFMMHRDILKLVTFNENMPDLRREDTLFSYDLMQKKVGIEHIENPVYHLGLDPFESAIKKEHDSLKGLKYIVDLKLIDASYTKLSKLYALLVDYKLTAGVAFIFNIFKTPMLRNLSSSEPSLVIFDLYRIGYLCSLKGKFQQKS